jgi:hypothetical protein
MILEEIKSSEIRLRYYVEVHIGRMALRVISKNTEFAVLLIDSFSVSLNADNHGDLSLGL